MHTAIPGMNMLAAKPDLRTGLPAFAAILVGGLALLLMTGEAVAALPEIPEVTSAVATSRPEIARQQERLLQERAALTTRAAMNKAECQTVKEKSPEEARCIESSSALSTDVDQHVQATLQFIVNLDSMVVDARNVPSGLPKSVEDQIPATPAGRRIRKAFQVIIESHDWPVAVAWFKDALRFEPGDPGILRLIDLAEYTMNKGTVPQPPAIPRQLTPAEQADIAATTAALDHIGDNWLENEISERCWTTPGEACAMLLM